MVLAAGTMQKLDGDGICGAEPKFMWCSWIALRETSEDVVFKAASVRGLKKPDPVFAHLYRYCCSIGDPLAFDVRPT
ncbi:MAG: hypothetical protein ABSB50_18140 [Terracidiphilus sp.]